MKNTKQNISLTFAGGVTDEIRAWMVTAGFAPGQERDAVRALVAMALASTPDAGLISSRAGNAFDQVRRWAIKSLMQHLAEMNVELQRGNLGGG